MDESHKSFPGADTGVCDIPYSTLSQKSKICDPDNMQAIVCGYKDCKLPLEVEVTSVKFSTTCGNPLNCESVNTVGSVLDNSDKSTIAKLQDEDSVLFKVKE